MKNAFRWASLIVMGIGAIAHGDPTFTVGQLGCQLRRALGFDAQTLSALGVDSGTYGSVVAAATSYCESHRETIEPLLAAVRIARAEAFQAYEKGEDTIAKDDALLSAIDSLANASGDAVTTMTNLLTSEQRTQFARIADNRLLDFSLALLELTSEQRSGLRAAQRTRDLVLRNHSVRKDLQACKTANEQFATATNSILTNEQRNTRTQLIETMWSHWQAAQVSDEAAMAP